MIRKLLDVFYQAIGFCSRGNDFDLRIFMETDESVRMCDNLVS